MSISRWISQKLLLVLLVWSCIVVNVLAESYMRAFTGYPKYITSQWYAGTNMRHNSVREVCDQLEVYYGFSFRIWNGGNSPASCVGSNSTNSYSIGLAFRYTNDNSCTSKGHTFDPVTGQCVDPNPPPKETYHIKIEPSVDSTKYSYLAAISPSEVPSYPVSAITPTLIARVYNQDNEMKSNVPILLNVVPVEGVAGHVALHAVREKNVKEYGELKSIDDTGITIAGNTGVNGFEFTYKAPIVSGDYTILASCTDGKDCFQLGDDQVWVGVDNLTSMLASSDYQFIGQTDYHPVNTNHFATNSAIKKLQNIAKSYHKLFPDDPILHINDISLERGGKFDVYGKWSRDRDHQTHRAGYNIDIRSNEFYGGTTGDLPYINYVYFYNIAKRNGCRAKIHSNEKPNEHYHLTCR